MLARPDRHLARTLVVLLILCAGLPLGDPALAQPDSSAPSEPSARTRTVTIKARGRNVQTNTFELEKAPNGQPMRAGGLLVRFRGSSGATARDEAHRAAGAEKVELLRSANIARVSVPPGATARAMAAYRGRSEVEWVQPDYVRQKLQIPNDPKFVDQWGLTIVSGPAAWDVTHGSSNVRLAILDCGIYTESSSYIAPDGGRGHPDLRGKVVAEHDFTGSAYGADDLCDHGTHVAGIAAAKTANAIGGAGLGFDTALLNGKVLDDSGSGSDAEIAAGINWAVSNGAKVVSMSLGGVGSCSDSPIVKDAVAAAWQAGVVIVAAAGNSSSESVLFPANCPNVVAVAASTQTDGIASFSNYGSGVELAAPGQSILSTNYVGEYETMSGTSMATPFVSGLMALVWTTSYGASAQAVVDRVLATADQVAGTGTLWTAGRINAAAAVGGSTTTPPPSLVSAQPDLDLSLSAATTSVKVKTRLTYSAVIANVGTQAATRVTLTDDLPLNSGFSKISSPRGKCRKLGSQVSCPIGNLAAGQSVTVTLVYKPKAAGTLTVTVASTLAEADPVLSNNQASASVTVIP